MWCVCVCVQGLSTDVDWVRTSVFSFFKAHGLRLLGTASQQWEAEVGGGWGGRRDTIQAGGQVDRSRCGPSPPFSP